MKFEGRAMTKEMRAFAVKKAPEGTVLIVRGFMEWHNSQGWTGCLRFVDANDNILKEMPYR